MASLPSNLSYTKIVGRFLRAVTDTTDDPDAYPDGVAMEGLLITFSSDANPPRVRTAASVPPTTIVIGDVQVTTNSDGDIVSPDGSLGVYLVASDDPDMQPTGWTYTCTIQGPDFVTASFSFIAPSGGELDLTTLVPMPSNPGAEILLWQQVVAEAEAARDDAQDAAEAAAASAASVKTYRSDTFTHGGVVAVGVGQGRVYNDTGKTIILKNVRASIGSAPTGASLIVDVNKNGTTVFTTQANRPTLTDGTATAAPSVPNITAWAPGEYLSVDIDQVGSGNPGTLLTVTINSEVF